MAIENNVSEPVKTPGQVLWENLKLIINDVADDEWRDIPDDAQWKLNQLALIVYKAVEEQRRCDSVPKCECGSKSNCEVMGQYLCTECLKDAFLMSNNGA